MVTGFEMCAGCFRAHRLHNHDERGEQHAQNQADLGESSAE
jgi:hypothetical protein